MRTYLVVICRTDDTIRRGRRPVLGVVAPGGAGDLSVRPFRAIVTFRAQEATVLFDGCGRGRDCSAKADVAPGASIANQPVWVGPVSARWALLFGNGLGCPVALIAKDKGRSGKPWKASCIPPRSDLGSTVDKPCKLVGAVTQAVFPSVNTFSRTLFFVFLQPLTLLHVCVCVLLLSPLPLLLPGLFLILYPVIPLIVTATSVLLCCRPREI